MTFFSCKLRRLLYLSYVEYPDFFEVKDFITLQRCGEALELKPNTPKRAAGRYLNIACQLGKVPEGRGGIRDTFQKFLFDPAHQFLDDAILESIWKEKVTGYKDIRKGKPLECRGKKAAEEALSMLLNFKREKQILIGKRLSLKGALEGYAMSIELHGEFAKLQLHMSEHKFSSASPSVTSMPPSVLPPFSPDANTPQHRFQSSEDPCDPSFRSHSVPLRQELQVQPQ